MIPGISQTPQASAEYSSETKHDFKLSKPFQLKSEQQVVLERLVEVEAGAVKPFTLPACVQEVSQKASHGASPELDKKEVLTRPAD